jgi:DNA-binding CsgD family transcriptional regulator
VFDSHQHHGSEINPYHAEVMVRIGELDGEVFTSSNRDIVDRKVWDGSIWINEYVRPARVDHFLGSMRIVGKTGIGLGFMRQAGDKPFTVEDCEILHLLNLGVGPCFDHQSPRLTLAPRVRQTLDVLLTGATDKDIAATLRLSPHTVRQYVKVILRAYGASNRSQLITLARDS